MHNYTMLVFCSEDKIKTFWRTPNSGSLWKKLCLWVNPSRSERGTINSINKLPLVFSNASFSGFPPLLSTTLSLFFLARTENEIDIVRRRNAHMSNETYTVCIHCRTKDNFPFHLFSSDTLWHSSSIKCWFQVKFFFAWMSMTFMWHLH